MINRSRPISRYIFTNLKLITSYNLTPHSYCTSKKNEWADEKIDYLDESGTLIHSGPGIRYTEPGIDNHIMVGALKQPFSNSHAVAKIVEIVKRWKWGPQMETHLDKLQFVPNMTHVMQALKAVSDGDACLSLFKWAKRQEWYKASDEVYVSLIERLNECRDFDGIQSVFDDLVDETGDDKVKVDGFSAFSRIVQCLAKAEKLEVSFCCFKKIQESGCRVDTKTYNSLINLFLEKGLPFKAFEIYENMEGSGCSLDGGTYELMIPSLAKSGRIDAALKLFQQMKEKNIQPGFTIFSSLVDSLGKAGRLDTAMKAYMEMQGFGIKPSAMMFVSMIESYVKAGKLDMGLKIWDEMKKARFRPNYGLYTLIVESHAKSGKLETAMSVFSDMEKAGFLPTPSTYSCLLEMHASSGRVDDAMKLYNSMSNAGVRPGLSTFSALLTLLAKKKLVDIAAKILLEMKAMGYAVDVTASDVLMVFIKEASVDHALRWLRFMGSSGIRTNNFIIRQLFESCMKNGLYESAKPLLENYVESAAKVDLILYTSILAHLVRCQDEQSERQLMSILSATKHKAHEFMCGLFTGPEQRKQPVLTFVREFFQNIDYESEEGAARYFVNVLLNYLVLMGQINRARCVWKVSYENKLFPKAIVFDQHIAWSLDVRNLSVGAALIAVVHTLHRFRKRMLYYGVVPRRIKLVTGPTLKIVIAQMLSSVESPFEVSKVVLRAPGDSVSEWFKKPIVQQFLLNEIPSRSDILMHKLNILFPSSAPEIRSMSPPKPLVGGRTMPDSVGRDEHGAKVVILVGDKGGEVMVKLSGMYDDNKGCQGSMTWTFYIVVDVPSVDGTFSGGKVEISGKQLCKAEAHRQTYWNEHSILQ
ncbi:Pentatricopeptide repeat-containing protein [Artemisia annua]|uniref:Pentatricopeptide repeat-containing protein n=1 Tax=Artemisia annua TaxID=35608 RepID=A0A2U1NFL7_ARTAN|nr:Pentatricopeptide repeat-containing protein [Artemisia annua]